MATDSLSSRSNRLNRLLPALRAGAILAIPLALAIVPLEMLQQVPDVCIWRRVFGVECWGCGMTRALASMLKGEIAAAIAFNWRIVIVGPLMVYITARFAWRNAAQAVRQA